MSTWPTAMAATARARRGREAAARAAETEPPRETKKVAAAQNWPAVVDVGRAGRMEEAGFSMRGGAQSEGGGGRF